MGIYSILSAHPWLMFVCWTSVVVLMGACVWWSVRQEVRRERARRAKVAAQELARATEGAES